jgi:very-short-patch-repair endonuclease
MCEKFINKRKLCDNENCDECFNKSFASHEKSIYWNKKNTIKPRQVFKGSSNVYYFNCDKCNHIISLRIDNIVYLNNWCKYCSNQSLCDNENCLKCFNKSFASYEKSIYWSEKNNIIPRFIFKNTTKKYIFDCTVCEHELVMSLNNVSNGSWCKYCNTNRICYEPECIICFNKTIASHEKICYLSKNNKINPRQITKNSNDKLLFECNICNNEFDISAYHLTENKWCKFCRKKTEKKFMKKIKIDYDNVICQYYTDWCINKETCRKLPFDFVLHTEKIIIELDGIQHFKQVSNWKTPEEQFIRDIFKMKCANDNKYSVIRIFQEDVFNDKYEWYEELKKNIHYLSNLNEVKNIYMCKNENLYNKFKII